MPDTLDNLNRLIGLCDELESAITLAEVIDTCIEDREKVDSVQFAELYRWFAGLHAQIQQGHVPVDLAQQLRARLDSGVIYRAIVLRSMAG